jgi:hypothetical protein
MRKSYDVESRIKTLLLQNPYRTRDDFQLILSRKDGQHISDFIVSHMRSAFLADVRFLVAAGVCDDLWARKRKLKRTPTICNWQQQKNHFLARPNEKHLAANV